MKLRFVWLILAGLVVSPCFGENTVAVEGPGWYLTLEEIDRLGGAETAQAAEMLHAKRVSVLHREVSKRLLQAEADRRGITLQDLVKTEVMDKIPMPSEKEVDAFLESHKADIQESDVSRVQVSAHIKRMAEVKRYNEYVASLVEKARIKINLTAPPPYRAEIVVDHDSTSRGPKDAPITIVEYADFGCGYCAKAVSTVKELLTKYKDQIRVVYKHMPNIDMKGAVAAQCAADQGKFWEVHDALYSQGKGQRSDAWMSSVIESAGLDKKKFETCTASGTHPQVIKDMEEGKRLGATGTPAFFINGRLVQGAQPISVFENIITKELSAAKVASK